MKRFLVMFIAALIVLAMVPQASDAHVNPTGPVNPSGQSGTIVIKGVIKSIQGTTWIVGDTPIEVTAGTSISGSPTVGTAVTIIVVRGSDDKLVAQSVVVIVVI